MNRRDLLLHEKRKYGLEQTISFKEEQMLQEGYPIQHIIGYVEFLNVKIKVNSKVLIPRYETEEMVDLFLKINQLNKPKILDLCCGSGFIGLAIKKNLPSADVTLSDISSEALKIAQENAEWNNLNKSVKFIQSDLFNNINEKYDVIISNPPYLDINDKEVGDEVRNFEPHIALFAPEHGWYFYQQILDNYKHYLNPNGLLLLEINPKHLQRWLNIPNIKIIEDINHKSRFVLLKNI